MNVKEKVLLFGGSNSGKTHAALVFVQNIVAGGKRGFVIDADDGTAKLIDEMSEFELLKSVVDTDRFQIVPTFGYDSMLTAMAQLRAKFKPTAGDVVVLEAVANLWDWSQAEFTNTVKKQSVAQIQLDKSEHGQLQYGGLDGRSEWPVIKKLYFDITIPTLQTPAHVIWTSPAKDLVAANDKIDVMEMFGPVKQKYEGEKNSHFKMDTVVHMAFDRKQGTRAWSTVKDRGKRPLLTRIPYSDFFAEYYGLHELTPPWTHS